MVNEVVKVANGILNYQNNYIEKTNILVGWVAMTSQLRFVSIGLTS